MAGIVLRGLESESSTKRVGEGTSFCLRLCDLHTISTRGFMPRQHAHVRECQGCRHAYNEFMRLKRNVARERIGLSPWEDQWKR